MDLTTLIYENGRGWSDDLPTYDGPNQLVLAFGSSQPEAVQAPIAELVARYPQSIVVGCSSSGEIHDTFIYDQSLAVAIIRFKATAVRAASAKVSVPESSFAAGLSLATALTADDLRAVFVLSDGMVVNGSKLVEGLNEKLPESVVVTGGLAGDGANFEKTWVLNQGQMQTGVVTAVGFYGDHIHIGHGSKGGWDIFGHERTVTASQGSVLYELDGKPALELYKTYLGERAAELPAAALLFPLALRTEDSSKQIVRTILSINEAEQSMTFAGDIPEGARVQLMKANFDRLIDGAMEAAKRIDIGKLSQQPEMLSIAISCVGRRLVLGERAEEELEATLDALPPGTSQIGFYSYGEISPYDTGFCDLHNQTMTLTTISES
ncbi:MAG: FIST C-terminal domain-containing protein [Anaerolineales bacterium]|nr:FIST C-terminal domain-containing protein [Anaerolineales bacterium]